MLEERKPQNKFALIDADINEVRGCDNSDLNDLIEAMRNMPVSKEKALFLPESVFNIKQAPARVQYAKDVIKKTYPALSLVAYRTKLIKDASDKYLGMRVWRIN